MLSDARALIDEMTTLAERTGMPLWIAQATHNQADLQTRDARLASGEFAAAIKCTQESRTRIEASGVRINEAEVLRIEAEIVAQSDAATTEDGLIAAIAAAALMKELG